MDQERNTQLANLLSRADARGSADIIYRM